MHLVQTAFTTLHGRLSEATSRHHERQYWRTTMLIAHIHRSILATIERSKTKPPKKIRRAKSVVQIVWKKQTIKLHSYASRSAHYFRVSRIFFFFLFPFSFPFFLNKQAGSTHHDYIFFFLFFLFLFSFSETSKQLLAHRQSFCLFQFHELVVGGLAILHKRRILAKSGYRSEKEKFSILFFMKPTFGAMCSWLAKDL